MCSRVSPAAMGDFYLNKMHPALIIAILLGLYLLGISYGDQAEGDEGFGDGKNLADSFHPLLQGSNTQPYGTETQSINLKKDIL